MSSAKAVSLLAAARQLLVNEDAAAAREARRKAEEALKTFEEANDSNGYRQALFEMVTADLMQEQPLEAIRMVNDKLEVFRHKGDKKGEATMLLALALAHLTRKESAAALKAAQGAAELFHRLGDLMGEFRVYQQAMVNINLITGAKKEALAAANQAMNLSKRLPGESIKADAFYAVMQARMAMESKDALAAAAEALAFYKKVDDLKGQASTLCAMAQAYLSKKDAGAAVKASQEALQAYRDLGSTKGTVEAVGFVVKALIQSGQFAEALKVAENQDSIFKKDGNLQGQASIALTIIYAHQSQEEDPEMHANEALEIATSTLELCRSVGDRKGEAEMWLKIAETHVTYMMLEDTLAEAQEALMIFRDLNDQEGEEKANIVLTEVYIRRGEPALAPLHSEGIDLLAKIANAIASRDGQEYQAANDRLTRIGGIGLLTETEQAGILAPVISADPDAAMEFMKSNSPDDGADQDEDVRRIRPDRVYTREKTQLYMGFRFSGIGYGPRFRCVDFSMCKFEKMGGNDEQLGYSVLQLQDASVDWERGLRLHPALLDCALQSSAAVGPLMGPDPDAKGKDKK